MVLRSLCPDGTTHAHGVIRMMRHSNRVETGGKGKLSNQTPSTAQTCPHGVPMKNRATVLDGTANVQTISGADAHKCLTDIETVDHPFMIHGVACHVTRRGPLVNAGLTIEQIVAIISLLFQSKRLDIPWNMSKG